MTEKYFLTGSAQRPLLDNTQHSQQTNILDTGGIRTQDLSSWAAADLRLKLRGHWDWGVYIYTYIYIYVCVCVCVCVCFCFNIIRLSAVMAIKWTEWWLSNGHIRSSCPTKLYMHYTCNFTSYIFHPTFRFIWKPEKYFEQCEWWSSVTFNLQPFSVTSPLSRTM